MRTNAFLAESTQLRQSVWSLILQFHVCFLPLRFWHFSFVSVNHTAVC